MIREEFCRSFMQYFYVISSGACYYLVARTKVDMVLYPLQSGIILTINVRHTRSLFILPTRFDRQNVVRIHIRNEKIMKINSTRYCTDKTRRVRDAQPDLQDAAEI